MCARCKKARRRTRGAEPFCLSAPSFGDDVDKFAGDDDDLCDGEALGEALDFGGFACGGFKASYVSIK